MMKRLLHLVCLSCVALPLFAAEQPALVVRHEHYFVVVNDAELAPTITARSKSYFRYAEGLALQVIDDEAEVRLETLLPVGADLTEQVPGALAPYYLVIAEPGYNGVIFDADRPWGIVAAGRWGLGTNGAVPQMYLYVPPECESFKVTCHAPSPREGGRVTILDPDGADVAVVDGEFDTATEDTIEVQAEHRGRAWSLIWGKPQTAEASLDDMMLFLDGYLAPLLWQDRGWAEKHGPVIWQRHKAVLDEQAQE